MLVRSLKVVEGRKECNSKQTNHFRQGTTSIHTSTVHHLYLSINNLHSHSLENRVVILQFKWKRKVKHDIGPVRGHITIESRTLVGVDHDEGEANVLFVLLCLVWNWVRVLLVVPLDQVSKANLLGQQILESLLLLGQLGFGVLNILAHGFHVLLGSRGKSLPGDFLLLLGDNVHGHENVQGIVDSSANVLLVEGSVGILLAALGHDLLDELVGHLIVGGGPLFFYLLADHHGKVPQSPSGAGGSGRPDASRIPRRRLFRLFGGPTGGGSLGHHIDGLRRSFVGSAAPAVLRGRSAAAAARNGMGR